MSLTFQQLVIRVAEYLGVADQSGTAYAIPTDAKDLELCKRLVNDGLRRFYSSHPKGRWHFLEPLISITFTTSADSTNVSSDNARYYLPAGVMGAPMNPWTYGTTGPRKTIQIVDEAVIRELFANAGSTSGDPCYACHRPLASSEVSGEKRWEVVFWPTPSTVYTVKAKVRVFPTDLTADADYPFGGAPFDDAVLAACLAEAEKKVDDAMSIHNPYFEKVALPKAVRIDSQLTPRTLGSDGGDSGRRSWYSGVDTYNNIEV